VPAVAGKVIETGVVDTSFSSRPQRGDNTASPFDDKRRALEASTLDFYSNRDQLIRIEGLAEYVVDREVIDERRS